jgi:hypothetical protein
MNTKTMARATTLLLLMIGAPAGCAKTHLAFDKPGVAEADLRRDQNECLRTAMTNEGGRILMPKIDHDTVIRCMEARGYTATSK